MCVTTCLNPKLSPIVLEGLNSLIAKYWNFRKSIPRRVCHTNLEIILKLSVIFIMKQSVQNVFEYLPCTPLGNFIWSKLYFESRMTTMKPTWSNSKGKNYFENKANHTWVPYFFWDIKTFWRYSKNYSTPGDQSL